MLRKKVVLAKLRRAIHGHVKHIGMSRGVLLGLKVRFYTLFAFFYTYALRLPL